MKRLTCAKSDNCLARYLLTQAITSQNIAGTRAGTNNPGCCDNNRSSVTQTICHNALQQSFAFPLARRFTLAAYTRFLQRKINYWFTTQRKLTSSLLSLSLWPDSS